MTLAVPPDLAEEARSWSRLGRTERVELGRTLRRLGLSYREIGGVIPVPKSTLAGWCRDIVHSPEQSAAIRRRMVSRRGVPRNTQRRRHRQIQAIRAQARTQARDQLVDPLFVAGTTLYWAEGAKTGRVLALANSDPRLCRFFIAWVRRHHDRDAEFVLKLNLHQGNDEPAARRFWESATELPGVRFYKTYVKAEGTGHRRNHLPHGVCMVRMRRSTDAWIRTMVWIDVVGEWRDSGHC